MIQVEQIKIDLTVPSDEVRMVTLQPYIQLSDNEPFQWPEEEATVQLDAINRTLDLAQEQSGGGPAHFTVFPEYSIPGNAGATIIDDRVSSVNWHNQSIVIAGLHGLTKAEYRELCESLDANVADTNAADAVPDGQWVNCCAIWVKDQDGTVQRWVQPKIRPAWPERDVACADMFLGTTVYVFEMEFAPNTSPCRFVTLVCYDWVAKNGGTTVIDEVLQQLNTQSGGNPTQLHWVFVIQHNDSPNHDTFLNSTHKFLTDPDSFPLVDTRDAVVFHANTAVSPDPSPQGTGAFSACVFAPGAYLDVKGCRPTVCMQPNAMRNSDTLKRCKDVVFREMGACIHMFRVRVPRFVTPDATDRAHPVLDAHVFPTRDSVDPRLCGAPVPAAIKWVNDSFDQMAPLSATTLAGCSLQANAETIGPDVVNDMRACDGPGFTNRVNWATCSRLRDGELRKGERASNVDCWDDHESDALKHLVHSITSLGLVYNYDVAGTPLHCDLQHDSGYINVVTIRGETHLDCRRHYDETVPKIQTDPVLVITRDRENLIPTPEEYSKFFEVEGDDGLRFVDYQTLGNFCRTATDTDALRNNLDGLLPGTRRIV